MPAKYTPKRAYTTKKYKGKFSRSTKIYKGLTSNVILSSMTVDIPFAQAANYSVLSGVYAAFSILPVSPFNLLGQGPGMLQDFLRLYSVAYVKKAVVMTTFISKEAGSGESLNIVASPASGFDLDRTIDSQYFNALQATPGAQQKFMSPSTGGHDIVTFRNTIYPIMGRSSSSSYSIRSNYTPAGVFEVYDVDINILGGTRGMEYAYTPVQSAECQFQVTRKIVYTFVFMNPHVARPFFTATPSPVADQDFRMEMESQYSQQRCPVQRQVTKGLKAMYFN